MARICVFGDSIAWGSWDVENGGWVRRLQSAGMKRATRSDRYGDRYSAVYNCGVAGDKLADLAERFNEEMASRAPNVVVLAIGINDCAHNNYDGTPLDQFRRNYEDLINRTQSRADDIVLVTPTNVDESRREHEYHNEHIEKFATIIRSLANRYEIACADVFGSMTPEDLKPDGLHPSAQGHEKLFNLIEPVVFSVDALN